MSMPWCIFRSAVYGSMRVPKSEVTQPRVGQIDGVEARSDRWSSKYSCSSRRLCSWREASVSSEESLPGSAVRFASPAGAGLRAADRTDGEVPLGVLELGHRRPQLRVEPLDPVEGRRDVGDLLLDQEHLGAELGVLLLEDRVLGGGPKEGEVVADGEQADEADAGARVGGVLQPLAGHAELAHRLRM